MLVHLGRPGPAAAIHNAWLRTLEEGVRTSELEPQRGTRVVGTQAFAKEVIARLGLRPMPVQHESKTVHADIVETVPGCAA